ncbi:MAG: MaoC family dehydratase [Deltaproteobacteria bacterium]|nr:MaoC family dehydratase [Deltaproteobacteria bacterium]
MDALGYAPGEVYVGRDLGGRRTIPSAADVAHYAAGTGDSHPLYRETTAGGPFAPALLYHSEVYRDLGWYLPNLIGNLHAKQEWELFAPMPLGQAVRTRSTVVSRYRKRDRDYIVNEILITDDDGRWLQRSRTHQSFLADIPADEIVLDKSREQRSERRFEIAPGGAALPEFRRVVSLAMCEAFSGPVKNYHTDREMARALGFPDVVVQGMLSICLISELMTRAFGLGWLAGGQLQVSLVNVLWGEEAISTGGSAREPIREGSRWRVPVDVWCAKDDGTKTIVGQASALR